MRIRQEPVKASESNSRAHATDRFHFQFVWHPNRFAKGDFLKFPSRSIHFSWHCMRQMKRQVDHGHTEGGQHRVEGDFGDPIWIECREDAHVAEHKEHHQVHTDWFAEKVVGLYEFDHYPVIAVLKREGV